MNFLENDFAAGLFDAAEPPCISLYQPTHRNHPENQQDPIRFRNLVEQIEASLQSKYERGETDALIEPFAELAGNENFWNHTLDGLAVLAARGLFRVYRLQRRVPELPVVAESFHLKPLRRILQSADRYQVLGITRERVRLFEGNRDVLDEIELAPEVPRTLTDALGEEITDPRLTVSNYGGTQSPAMRHGHGGRKDQIKLDAERFFRAVDREVGQHHSLRSKLPLILAGLPENQAVFREVSRNSWLMEDGLDVNPDAVSAEKLRELAWQKLEPHYLSRLGEIVDRFRQSKGTGLATEEAGEAAAAALTGRVDQLLVDADFQRPGRVDLTTGAVAYDDLADADVDDILDDLAEMVSSQGGEVVIVPHERMPTETGLAAIYRY